MYRSSTQLSQAFTALLDSAPGRNALIQALATDAPARAALAAAAAACPLTPDTRGLLLWLRDDPAPSVAGIAQAALDRLERPVVLRRARPARQVAS